MRNQKIIDNNLEDYSYSKIIHTGKDDMIFSKALEINFESIGE